MLPSLRAAGTRLALGGTGGPCSWGGRRTPRRRRSPHRSKPHAACRYRTLKDSHQSTPPSALRNLASRTASASTHRHKPENRRQNVFRKAVTTAGQSILILVMWYRSFGTSNKTELCWYLTLRNIDIFLQMVNLKFKHEQLQFSLIKLATFWALLMSSLSTLQFLILYAMDTGWHPNICGIEVRYPALLLI